MDPGLALLFSSFAWSIKYLFWKKKVYTTFLGIAYLAETEIFLLKSL